MRLSLLYNPLIAIERLAVALQRRRRRRRLGGTPAAALGTGHIDSLELLELLENYAPATVYDVGANVGTWTCLAKSLYPAAKVEAFEPLAAFADTFKKTTASWPGDVRLHVCALGPSDGVATLHVMDFVDASSLLPLSSEGRSEFKLTRTRDQQVSVRTMDSIIASEALPPPDLLKLDVQGFELEVLRGADKALGRARAVICEVSFRRFYEGQPLFGEILNFMEARGFAMHALGTDTALGTPLVQADVLFLRPGVTNA